nr:MULTISPECIES: hypothetical protein [Roseobacteraceae]
MVPTGGDGDEIDAAIVTATEVDREGPIVVYGCYEVVITVHPKIVGFQIAVSIIDGNGPERMNRYVRDHHRMQSFTILGGNAVDDIRRGGVR